MSLYNLIIFKEKNNGHRLRLNNSSKTFQINRNLLVFLKVFFSAVSTYHQDFNRGIRGRRTGFFGKLSPYFHKSFVGSFQSLLRISHILKEKNETKSEG